MLQDASLLLQGRKDGMKIENEEKEGNTLVWVQGPEKTRALPMAGCLYVLEATVERARVLSMGIFLSERVSFALATMLGLTLDLDDVDLDLVEAVV